MTILELAPNGPGAYPRQITVRGPSSLAAMWHNPFHGLLVSRCAMTPTCAA